MGVMGTSYRWHIHAPAFRTLATIVALAALGGWSADRVAWKANDRASALDVGGLRSEAVLLIRRSRALTRTGIVRVKRHRATTARSSEQSFRVRRRYRWPSPAVWGERAAHRGKSRGPPVVPAF